MGKSGSDGSSNEKNQLADRLSAYLDLGFNYEKEAFNAMQVVKNNTMLVYECLVTLYEQVVYCEKNNIEGDFVECGTWKGGAMGLMALANMQNSSRRRNLHLFDAFEEICQPDELLDDPKLISEVKKQTKIKKFSDSLEPMKGIYDQYGGAGTLVENKKLLEETIHYPASKIHYHKGWFQDTVPVDAAGIHSIAILRLDGDWYQSTKICLEHLFDRVVPGGVVIIDDYGYNIGCKNAVDEFLASRGLNPLLHYVNKITRYFIK